MNILVLENLEYSDVHTLNIDQNAIVYFNIGSIIQLVFSPWGSPWDPPVRRIKYKVHNITSYTALGLRFMTWL